MSETAIQIEFISENKFLGNWAMLADFILPVGSYVVPFYVEPDETIDFEWNIDDAVVRWVVYQPSMRRIFIDLDVHEALRRMDDAVEGFSAWFHFKMKSSGWVRIKQRGELLPLTPPTREVAMGSDNGGD